MGQQSAIFLLRSLHVPFCRGLVSLVGAQVPVPLGNDVVLRVFVTRHSGVEHVLVPGKMLVDQLDSPVVIPASGRRAKEKVERMGALWMEKGEEENE